MLIHPCMPRRLACAGAAALCVGMLALAINGYQSLSAAEPHADVRYILLRNGEVLNGSIERDGDHYLIRRSGSAELRIPYKEISHVGKSMRALYQHKANRIVEFRADEHMDLASWCLQNGLEAEVTHHILRAETINPIHPHLSLLKARLERYLANGNRHDSHATETELVDAVRNEPIPITAAPLHEDQETLANLQPSSALDHQSPSDLETPSAESSAATQQASPREKPTAQASSILDTLGPVDPNIDAPELISGGTSDTLANAVELPDLLPIGQGGTPPTVPDNEVNEEINPIR